MQCSHGRTISWYGTAVSIEMWSDTTFFEELVRDVQEIIRYTPDRTIIDSIAEIGNRLGVLLSPATIFSSLRAAVA